MNQQFIQINCQNEITSPRVSTPIRTPVSDSLAHKTNLNLTKNISSHHSIPDGTSEQNQYIDPRYLQFKELIEKRDASRNQYDLSIYDQELIASILYDFHHFKILIRPQQRIEFASKIFKYIKIGWLERGEFFFHKGDSNKTNLICILSGKTAIFQKKSESLINQEMDLLGRIANLNHQIAKIEKSSPTINNEISKSIHQLKQRIEHNQENLNQLRLKDEDDLLRNYNFKKYFLTENVCSYRRIQYAEHGSTLSEAQVINGCSCDSTAVCLQKCFYFQISSTAYREIFELEITKNSFICNILKQNFPGAKDDSLRRVSYDFKEEIYEYNKVIFEENDSANLFMIIRQGEVEARRRIDIQPSFSSEIQQNSSQSPQLSSQLSSSQQQQLSPSNTSSSNSNQNSNLKNQQNQSQQSNQQSPLQYQLLKKFKGKNAYKEISIGILGQGQILGIEDLYNNKKTRSFKAISKSNETIIYYINKKQLDDVILLNDDYKLKKAIKNQSRHKSEYYDSRTDNLINFEQASFKQKEEQTLQDNLKKQYLPDTKNFKNIIQGWINQKQGQQQEELTQIGSLNTNSILRTKSSAPNLLNHHEKIEEDTQQQTTLTHIDNQKDEKSQSPIKIQRNQLRSLSQVPSNSKKFQFNFNISEVEFQSQQNLDSPLKKNRFYKQSCELSPTKINLIKTISMSQHTEMPFQSEIELINKHIEMKEQCYQYKQRQREKNGLLNSPYLAPQSASSSFDPLSSPITHQYHQTQHDQQLFEDTKKRLIFMKNFQNENKKQYNLKSENSLLNSILRKTSTMKLDVPQIIKSKGSLNEINNISQLSDENDQTSLSTIKKLTTQTIGQKGSDTITLNQDLQCDTKHSERKSENLNRKSLVKTQNIFGLPKQQSQLQNRQICSINKSNQIKSLQNLSAFSSYTDLNQGHFQQNLSGNHQQLQKSLTSFQKQKMNDFNENAHQNPHFNQTLESIIENEKLFQNKKNVQLPQLKLKLKNSSNVVSKGYTSSLPNSPIFTSNHDLQTNYSNINSSNINNENKANDLNNQQNTIIQFLSHDNLDSNSFSTQQNTTEQQFDLQYKQQNNLNKDNSQIQLNKQDETTKQILIQYNNSKNNANSNTELPLITNRSQSQQQFMNSKIDIPSGVIPLQSQHSLNTGYTDIVKRIGIDPSQILESQKFKILKNLNSIQNSQKNCISNSSRNGVNSLLQKSKDRKTLSSTCSPNPKANSQHTQNHNLIYSNRNFQIPQQITNKINEASLMIGKVNYSVK